MRMTNGHVPEPVVYLFFVCLTYAAALSLFSCASPLLIRAARSVGITTPGGSADYVSVAVAVAAAAAAAAAVGARWAP